MKNFEYPNPFKKGEFYVATEQVGDENNQLVEGQEYEFLDSAYDFHSGVVRYWFKSVATGNQEVLHLWIDHSDPNWEDLRKLRMLSNE